MKIVVKLISSNSEQPVFTVDTNKLSTKLANELIASISSSEMFSNTNTDYDELNKAMDSSKFPYHIDGIVDVIFD